MFNWAIWLELYVEIQGNAENALTDTERVVD